MYSEEDVEIINLTLSEFLDLFEEGKGQELEDYFIDERLVPLQAYKDIMAEKGLAEIREDENEEN